jgi:eukaryotic-like serine/threonine-protein kinase
VAQAVAFAHDRGVLHRDIKPHNVMVGRFGDVTLLDWGLAAALPGGDVRLPQVGASHALAGTPSYMAPEQLAEDERRCGVGTDVYLLGATLYHLLHGHAPHQGRSVPAILERVRVNRPVVDADSDAAQMLHACLKDDPQERPSAEAFVAWIARYRALRGARVLLAQADAEAASMCARLAADDLPSALRHLTAARHGQEAAMLAGATLSSDARLALLEPVVQHYLATGESEAALRLLDEHGLDAGPLRESVQTAVSALRADRRALAALAEDHDALVGLRTRTFVAAVTGAFWVLVPVGVHLYEAYAVPLTYEELIGGAVVLLLGSLALTTWARETLAKSLMNRVAKAVIPLASLMGLAALVRGMWVGVSPYDALVSAQMGWVALGAMAAVVLGPELWSIPLAHALGLVVTAFRPDWIWLVIALGDAVFAYAVLVPYRKASSGWVQSTNRMA